MTLNSLSFSSQATPLPAPPAAASQKRHRLEFDGASASDDVLSTPKSSLPPPKRPSPATEVPSAPAVNTTDTTNNHQKDMQSSELLEEEMCQQLLELEQVMSRSSELQQPVEQPAPTRLKVLDT